MSFTINTPITTLQRPAIRSLCKNHPDWANYLVEKSIVSAAAKNSEILEFALRHPTLTAQVDAILTGATIPSALENEIYEAKEREEEADYEARALSSTALVTQGHTFDVDAVIAGVEQFLAPAVKAEITKALQPIIAAANKPAVEIEKVVEVERVVEVAPGEKPRATIRKARKEKKTTFRTLYPSKAKDAWRDSVLTLWAGAECPPVDPSYVVHHQQMHALMSAIERSANVWLYGPAGTGKSTMPEQAAAALGRPFICIGFTRQTDVQSLVGGYGMENGSTVWRDGVLTQAIRQPGMVILLDELTIAPAGVQAIFQQVCSARRTLTIEETGEVVRAAEGVCFIVADNTNGSGDESGGLYQGTNIANAALITRFARMLPINYLTVQQEAEALANHTACPLDAALQIATFIEQARRLPQLAGVVISLRQMVAFVQAVQDHMSAKYAFEICLTSRMPATERAAIETLVDLNWHRGFEALMAGKAAPPQPSNSAAAAVFDTEDQF